MAKVQLNQVVKSYAKGQLAVRGIDLSIADREFVVLVGPSGCGKSTTLRMIAGLEEVTSGTIDIGDQVVNNLQARQRDISMVFQNYALYPHLTVFENMAFGLRLRKTPSDEVKKRVHEVARILDLEPYLERRPKQLSGGQRQRVAMGRAIVRHPSAYLFDEPLSNLDAELRMQMRGEIKRIHQTVNTTTIYVTHDQVEAMTLADRVVVMKDGRIQQVAAPQEIHRNPASRFVAGFIGSPGMNFLDVHIVDNGGLAVQLPDKQRLPVPDPLADRFGPHKGQQVTFGVRPEHLAPPGELRRGNSVPITADVTLIEPLGTETLLHFNIAGHEVIARAVVDALPRSGDAITLALALENARLFDTRTGKAL